MGLRRMKKTTFSWRFMQRYEAMKKSKGSGRAIIATARKIATVIWHMLAEEVKFEIGQMVERKVGKKSGSTSGPEGIAKEALIEGQEKCEARGDEKKDNGVKKNAKKTGVASKKRKKAG
jgi:hypothetical protein